MTTPLTAEEIEVWKDRLMADYLDDDDLDRLLATLDAARAPLDAQCKGYAGDPGASAPRCESYDGHPGGCFIRAARAPLDVERLARAVDRAFAGGVADPAAIARTIAREYADDPAPLSEQERLVADIRRMLPMVAIGHPELAKQIEDALAALSAPEREG